MPLKPDSRQIRVLAIQPGAFEDTIKCQLYYVQLNGEVGVQAEYDALSYVCGSPRDRQEIHIQLPGMEHGEYESMLCITRSAEQAIRHLRHIKDIVNMWVDAACINEGDKSERAQQVRMMGTIFARARRVHVWIGSGHAGNEAALRVIRDAYNVHHLLCAGGEKCDCPGTRHNPSHEIKKIGEALGGIPSRHRDLRAVMKFHEKSFNHSAREYAGGINGSHVSKLMSHLFDNSWFRRVWVIQEIMKSRTALVHCATEIISWRELITVHSWLASEDFMQIEPHVHPSMVTMPRIWSSLSPFSEPQRIDVRTHKAFALDAQPQAEEIFKVFISSLDLKATDNRDKIFAILSLAKDTANEEKMPAALRPNYEKSSARVFADFTRWWIIAYRSLDILSIVHCHRERTWQRMTCGMNKRPSLSRPSWTAPFEGRARWAQSALMPSFKFQATEDTTPDVTLLDTDSDNAEAGPLVIKLLGYRLADIEDIQHLSLSNQHKAQDASESFCSSFHHIFDPSNLAEHWKTSTASDHHVTSRAAQARDRLANHLWGHSGEVAAIDPFITKPGNGTYKFANSRSVASCTDPCFFTTASGMVGLCPWTAQKGDTIALLLGGKVPYLLRPQQDTKEFLFVGECFVKGIMHGEHFRELQNKVVEPTAFSIS